MKIERKGRRVDDTQRPIHVERLGGGNSRKPLRNDNLKDIARPNVSLTFLYGILEFLSRHFGWFITYPAPAREEPDDPQGRHPRLPIRGQSSIPVPLGQSSTVRAHHPRQVPPLRRRAAQRTLQQPLASCGRPLRKVCRATLYSRESFSLCGRYRFYLIFWAACHCLAASWVRPTEI